MYPVRLSWQKMPSKRRIMLKKTLNYYCFHLVVFWYCFLNFDALRETVNEKKSTSTGVMSLNVFFFFIFPAGTGRNSESRVVPERWLQLIV